MAYHQELLAIEKSGIIDFVYVPSVSRPSKKDFDDESLGKGRANNLLRLVLGMPAREAGHPEQLQHFTKPVLPVHHDGKKLLQRMNPEQTVIFTCGNNNVMDDIKYIARTNKIAFEKEDW